MDSLSNSVAERESVRNFWESHILQWEHRKYSRCSGVDFNASVKFRRLFALECLGPYLKGRRILELGCGSGSLARTLLDLGAKEYIGVDFAEAAIRQATQGQRCDPILRERARFHCDDAGTFAEASDIVFSLGLLDWVDPHTLRKLAERHRDSLVLHSFSAAGPGLQFWLHKAFSQLTYRRKGGVLPQYRQPAEVLEVFHDPKYQIRRHGKLSFGAFLSNFL